MGKPKITSKSPKLMEMEAGEYYWCACGRSASQPFCDGSHKGTGIEPHIVKIEEKRMVYWCMCKHSKTPPFCDGTHRDI